MAAGITNADNITLNLGSGGANVATDYLTTEGGHAQFVKLGIGGDGTLNQITSTNPLPVQLYSINPTFKTLPVGGGTNGEGITVFADISVGEVSLATGATLDAIVSGISADITSFKSGITLGIDNATGTTMNIEGTVSISSVATPTSFTSGTFNLTTDATVSLPGFTCESGIKVKNTFSGGQGDIRVGVGGVTPTDANSYLLSVSEELFVEINNVDNITFGTGSAAGATITYIGS
jgi:hypothetical protein